MSRFVIGDIHGNYRALLQCLDRSKFDMKKDLLIGLGDYCDGHTETAEVLLLLDKIPNKVLVLGNHDQWLINYLKTGATPDIWTNQGGKATIRSIIGHDLKVFDKLLGSCIPYYLTEDNKLFVHGGMKPKADVRTTDVYYLVWDRELLYFTFNKVIEGRTANIVENYSEVYLGHTTTEIFGYTTPFCKLGIFALDQGAGYRGKLTIMDIDTKQWWQSDKGKELYPGHVL